MDEHWAKIKDNITCSLCYELFNYTNRLPKGLPCLHSFCLSCLTNYVSKVLEEGNELLCPLCKKKFTILANESVNDLPTNPAIMNNVDIFPGNKEDSNIPVCENHGNKPYIFLCIVCKTGLCKFCITNLKDGLHANHKLEDYSTAFEELRKNINKTENLIDKYVMELDNVHSLLQFEVNEAWQKESESVMKREQEVIAKAKEWQKHMIEDIACERDKQCLDIAAKYDSLKEKLAKMRADLNTSKSLSESNDLNAFVVYKEIEKGKTLSIINEEIVVKFGKNTHRKNFVNLPTVEKLGMLVPHNKFTWYITDVQKFINMTQFHYSPTFFYLNKEWNLFGIVRSNDVEIYLEHSNVEREDLAMKVDCDFTLMSQIKSDVSHHLTHTFSKDNPAYGFGTFIRKEDFLDPTNGYVYENCAAFSVTMSTSQCYGNETLLINSR